MTDNNDEEPRVIGDEVKSINSFKSNFIDQSMLF